MGGKDKKGQRTKGNVKVSLELIPGIIKLSLSDDQLYTQIIIQFCKQFP